MSEPLIITLIAVTFNLGGMLVIYSFMAFFLARLHWRGHGVLAVLMTIIIAEFFWIVPTMIGLDYSIAETTTSYSFLFGNWLVSAFAVILFCQTVKGIPRELEDSARLDGSGWFRIYWHVVLPLVRQDLGLIALLIGMATTLPFLTDLTKHAFFPAPPLPTYDAVTRMLAHSAIATVPVIAIFVIVKRRLRHTTYGSGVPSVLSTT
jgi:ABC-type glycerol-3-phosphate transport system permease component